MVFNSIEYFSFPKNHLTRRLLIVRHNDNNEDDGTRNSIFFLDLNYEFLDDDLLLLCIAPLLYLNFFDELVFMERIVRIDDHFVDCGGFWGLRRYVCD